MYRVRQKSVESFQDTVKHIYALSSSFELILAIVWKDLNVFSVVSNEIVSFYKSFEKILIAPNLCGG